MTEHPFVFELSTKVHSWAKSCSFFLCFLFVFFPFFFLLSLCSSSFSHYSHYWSFSDLQDNEFLYNHDMQFLVIFTHVHPYCIRVWEWWTRKLQVVSTSSRHVTFLVMNILLRESSFQVVCWMQRVGIGSTDYYPIDISFIPIACFLDIVLIFYGEILSWSLIGFKGLRSLTKFSKQQWFSKMNVTRNAENDISIIIRGIQAMD